MKSYEKIAAIAMKNGLNPEVLLVNCGNFNVYMVRITVDLGLLGVVYKLFKRYHCETVNPYARTMEVWDVDDFNSWKEYNDGKFKLSEIFNTVYHETKDCEKALNAQKQYALKNNLMGIFNKIYE